jgi:DNA-binding GntR family transcriptional regulator
MECRTKEDQVADFTRERIISGVIARGSRLMQAEIAEQLDLSITPVREALKLLEAEGYISTDSYRGARVVPFDASASLEILTLPLLLETQLVMHAADPAFHADSIGALPVRYYQRSRESRSGCGHGA